MRFQAQLEASSDGSFLATCSEPPTSARGLSAASALERLRAEIRYRIELCPCSSVEDDFVVLDVVNR